MKRLPLTLFAISAVALSACTDPAYVTGSADERDEYRQTKAGGVIGGIVGAAAAIGLDANPVAGAAVGAGVGALIGRDLDKQAAELRAELDGGIKVENTGDRLIVVMPHDLLFDSDSAVVSANLTDDLYAVARNLEKYPNSTVQVLGHTDNTGSAEHNQKLSERRANAVADKLMAGGVAFERIQTIGRGEDQPVASNLTEEGKAQNRRVEIVILPTEA
ncbi:OmpA family protein [Shimia sp. SDUM112013]|uniref:OmpA family protein n=1 Tax=Shimia sp. SDUM112013 TaxID=3136160 RepID=UPI0032EDD075